jgi:S-adenosylmethionine:tRNA ribosyltransferase-isomerase
MTDIKLFDYVLPEGSVAQYPLNERDASRLLVVNRSDENTEDRFFFDLPEYIGEGDVLVFNDSRVIKARLIGEKAGTGARIELFLVNRINDVETILAGDAVQGAEQGSEQGTETEKWQALAKPAKRLHIQDEVIFSPDFKAVITGKTDDGFVYADFVYDGVFSEALERLGHVPLPPYIRRSDEEVDADRYQCVYAEVPGSVAAPTAGLHFTERLLQNIRKKGVETVFITLHVGLGTFQPVKEECIEDHKMHTEYYHINEEVRDRINRAKEEGRRIICVGTTSLRSLESAGQYSNERGWFIPESKKSGETDIFIYPGSRESFMTDGLITNFHLPKSTLLMLVSAFYDREKVLEIYREAIEKGYRFFSYGDAMLIL